MSQRDLILQQTAEWVVIHKPAGYLTIPGRGDEEIPVLHREAERILGKKLWVVHRLDRETSGVILFARTAEAHRKANQWFQKHEVKKTYHFLAQGTPAAPIFKVRSPIEGAPSTTQFEVTESYAEGFLGKARPLTGRRHQIRIHLSDQGYPIWGDSMYRGPNTIALGGGGAIHIKRVALHAAELILPSGERFEAPWPEDFSRWVAELRKSGTGAAGRSK